MTTPVGSFPDNFVSHQSPQVARRVLDSGAHTASSITEWSVGWAWAKKYIFSLKVTTAATQASDTLNVYIQRMTPAGSADDVVAFTQVLGNGGAVEYVADVCPDGASSDERAVTDGSLSAGTARKIWIGDAMRVKSVVVGAGEVAATGTLTLTENAAEGNTVTIGTVVYTFTATVTDPNHVLIGASASDSIDNLIAAINGDAGEGTLYGTGTTAHTLVTAAAGTGDTMDLTAVTAGSAGNSIATTDTLAGSSAFGAVTLEGGVGAVDDDSFTFTVTVTAVG